MSKIGIQSQSGVIQDADKLLAKQPIAYMLLGNALSLDFAKQIREASPKTIIPIRAQDDNWSLDAGVVDFAERSMRVAEPFLRAGVCDFLLPPNEPVVQNDVNARRLNEQMVQIAGIYKANGYRTGAYNFSVGNPDYPLWQYLNDGVVAADGWLFLHEYGSPSLQNDAANLSLRHRKARSFFSPIVQSILKIGITECFIDLGATGGAGGYRKVNNPTDDDLWWIKNLTAQLDWWDGELAKDDYVKFACGYGFGMLYPWGGEGSLKFDVAEVDTDRRYFIDWLKAGSTPIPPNPQPEPPTMTTAEKRSADAFTAAGVAYNKDAALFKYAQAYKLGYPVTNEYPAIYDGVQWINQGYAAAIVSCIVGDYGNVKAFDWLTGLPYVPPTNGGGTPPQPTVKRLTTADLPPELGLQIQPVNMPKGSKQWYIVQAGGWKQNVGTELIVHCIPLSGPAFDIAVTNRFASGMEQQKTNGSGDVKFDFGHGSAFTPPASPPNKIYCDFGDGTPIGDQLLFGFVNGSHLEGAITMQEVVVQ